LAAASYMQMFGVASTCSELMKSSILWNAPNSPQEKGPDAGQESNANSNFASPGGSLSLASSVVERTIPVGRKSQRKCKSYTAMSPKSPLKCNTQTSSPQVLNPSTSYPESLNQPVDSSLAFPCTFPFGINQRLQSEKVKKAENSRTLETPGPSESNRRIADYMTCESTKASSPLVIEKDVHVKVERLSDKEVHKEVSQPVSASQSWLSDQQTVPGSEQVQEDLLISPQSSSKGSTDERVTEGLPTLQRTSGTNAHADDDDRTERPSPNGPDRRFQCPTCGARFIRMQHLKQHTSIHSGVKPFQCDRCGKKFTRAYTLKTHHLKHSDLLVPDYLNQEQEETLRQYELGERGFESNSSVQMPVISQVWSTQDCESTFPLGSLGGLAEKEEEVPEQPKTNATAEAA
ncbi:Zinc finger and BTB domain-containing protein 44, partial [Apaloderma vittatum]